MDNELILRNAEEPKQEGVTQQDSCNNYIFDSTMLVGWLCFQPCSLHTVFLLSSVQPHVSQSYYLWMLKGFMQVKSLTVLGVVNFVGNTDVVSSICS